MAVALFIFIDATATLFFNFCENILEASASSF